MTLSQVWDHDYWNEYNSQAPYTSLRYIIVFWHDCILNFWYNFSLLIKKKKVPNTFVAQTPKKGKYEECLGEGRWLVFQDGEALSFSFLFSFFYKLQ